MLEFMRQNASGWFAKILLGGIALIFALYFGFSSGGPPAGGTAPIAKVNGENIPAGRFTQSVEGQMKAFGNNQGQDFRKIMEVNILQQMIRSTLMAQEANKLGLRITNEALANAIRSNPSFQQDGLFNEPFYLKQFKPYFERVNGENYEYALRQEMLARRLQGALTQASIVSNQALKTQLLLRDTQLSFEKLTVPLKPQADTKDSKTAIELAQAWVENPNSSAPQGQGIKVEKVENESLSSLLNTLPQESALGMLSCLIKIEAGSACDQSFPTPQGVMALRLISRENEATAESVQATLRNQLTQAKQNQILKGFSDALTQQAKIETFLTQ